MSIGTTITLEDDVVARLREASKAQAVPFKRLVNEAIRYGLTAMERPAPAERFRFEPLPIRPRPGVRFDNVSELLEEVEGPSWW